MASLWPEDFNAVCVRVCVAAHCALHCFVCPPICCHVGARAAACSAGFFLETSVISAPICAGTLSDENKASLLRFCKSPHSLPPPHPHTLHPLASRPPHRMRLRHVACRRSPLTVNQQIARAAPSTLLRAKCCDASCIPSAWFGYLWTTAGKYKYAYVYGFSGDLW